MRFSSILRYLGIFGLLLASAEQKASATQVYDFAIPGSEYSQWFGNNDQSLNRAFIATGGGSAQVTYNEASQIITLSILTTGNVYGVTYSPSGAAQLNTNNLLYSGATSSMTLTLGGAHVENSPYGLLGSTTVSGTGSVSNLGLGGPVTYNVMAKPMDWNLYTGSDANTGYINDMKAFGLANFFQYYATHEWGTDKLYASPLLVFQLWTGSVGPICGCQGWNSVSGDIHGTAVPEPASMALLGMGLLGGAVRRRRQANS